jgi:hypothetical protein
MASSSSSSAAPAAGKCTVPGCSACPGFLAQWYRPALCSACFHTIAHHFPGDWSEEVDVSNGRVYFKQRGTEERLFARPADMSDNTALTRVRELARQRQGAGGGPEAGAGAGDGSALTALLRADGVTVGDTPVPQVQMWASFLDGGSAGGRGGAASVVASPPPSSAAAAAAGTLPPGRRGGVAPPPAPASSRAARSLLSSEGDGRAEDDSAGRLLPGDAAAAAASSSSSSLSLSSAASTVSLFDAGGGGGSGSSRSTGGLSSPGRSTAGASARAGGGSSSAAASAAAAARLLEEADDDDDDDGDENGAGSKSPRALAGPTPGAGGSLVIAESQLPSVPTAVPAAALTHLALDLSQLTRKMGLGGAVDHALSPRTPAAAAPPTPAPAPAAALDSGAGASAQSSKPASSSSSADLLAVFSPVVDPEAGISSASQGAAAADGGAAAAAASSSSAPAASSSAAAAASSTGLYPSLPATSTPAVPPSPAPPAPPPPPEPTYDLSAYLGAVYGDPLLVDMTSPGLQDGAAGGSVRVLRVQQPAEETELFMRYIVVTPFTLLCLAPHPTKLGKGLLKWERSILSLQDMVTQPLFAPVAGPGLKRAAQDGDVVYDSLPFGIRGGFVPGGSAQASAAAAGATAAAVVPAKAPLLKRGFSASLRSFFSRSGSQSGASTPTAAAAPATSVAAVAAPPPPPPAAPTRWRMYGVGLLASFAAETPDTLTFLRTYRAGKRPVTLRGWLLKRKRNAWRQNAPLGPLAWKKRWFVLEATQITYYKNSASGSVCKGTIPLTGWVEVTRAGPDAGPIAASLAPDATTRPHAFVVRTGSTYHVFQASSASDAEEWIEAITINAQHVGAGQYDPQCVILQTHADAEALARTIAKRRADLLSSMSPGAAAFLPPELTIDLSASQVLDAHARGRSASSLLSSPSLAGAGRPAVTVAEAPPFLLNDEDDGFGPTGAAGTSSYSAAASAASSSASDGGGAGAASSADVEGGITLAEAEALVGAMGGEVPDDFLAQLPPAVAAALAAKYRPELAAQQAVPQPPPPPPPSPPVAYNPGPVWPSSAGGSPFAPPPGLMREASWIYLDDYDRPQGPFADGAMRGWLYGRYFGPDTLVRSADPLPLTPAERAAVPDEALDAATGAPLLFLPIATLFPDPVVAFAPAGRPVAHRAIKEALAYQAALTQALSLGIDRMAAADAVAFMQAHRLPPDVSVLLDVVEAQAEARQEAQVARAAAASSSSSRTSDALAITGGIMLSSAFF